MSPAGAGDPPAPEGWELRFVTDETRAREMERLYRDLGFETAVEPAHASDVRSDCGECPVVRLGLLRRISTRRPEEDARKEEEGAR